MSILDTVIKSIRNIALEAALSDVRKDVVHNGVAVIAPFSIRCEDTGETIIAMSLSENYYMFTVGKRTYYLIRETGEYDGWSEDGDAFAPKPNLYALDGGKINNKENENVNTNDECNKE